MSHRRRSVLAVTAGALGACALIAAVASGIRLPGFARALPFAPPIFHGVLQASSTDGLDFVVAPRALHFPADTQHQTIAADGGALLIYFDGLHEQLSMLDVARGVVEELPMGGDCDGSPPPGTACVDPVWVPLPDGRQRLYYSASPRGVDPALGQEPIEVHSAISEDGRRWEREPGVRLSGRSIVDPDVVALPGGGYRMYFTSLEPPPGAQPGGDLPSVYSAWSSDGLAFEREPGVRLRDASATSTVPLPEGGFRTYYHPFTAGILSARSPDGLNFEPEPGERVPAEPIPGSRWTGSSAPAVTRRTDGSWWMTFNAAREPRFPFNWIAVLRWGDALETGPPPPPPGPGG
jgi:hypothetical protein